MKQGTNILETSHGRPCAYASILLWIFYIKTKQYSIFHYIYGTHGFKYQSFPKIKKKKKLTYECSREAVHVKAPLWWRDANNGFKVAAPQRGSLLLCENDGWFCWFSYRECVLMTRWSTCAWRWKEIVDSVLVLQFWWCALGWWLFCYIFLSKNSDCCPQKKFWLLSRKKINYEHLPL